MTSRSHAALVHLGVPAEVVLDEWEHLAAVTREIAQRFERVYDTHLSHATTIDEATAMLARLQSLARTAVASALDAALTDAASLRIGTIDAT